MTTSAVRSFSSISSTCLSRDSDERGAVTSASDPEARDSTDAASSLQSSTWREAW